jgi:holo-[acyl-carrier protein] synthase
VVHSHDVALLAGTDLASASEVAESIERFGVRYLGRVYTSAELADCADGTGAAPARLAARFAAKEAVIKALGHAGDVDWRSVEVVRTDSGRPQIALHGAAAEEARRCGVEQLAVSLTHHGDLAHAVVVGWCRVRSGLAHTDEVTDEREGN